ncbi:MAG: PAS domain S-box protein [Deltaproteobacteria bacterium]|nr:PAS domain S-box protein [Deltaproteobacteria bacterium]
MSGFRTILLPVDYAPPSTAALHAVDAEAPVRRDPPLAAVPGSAEATITVDTTGAITSWNRAAEGMLGWAAREIVGRSAALLVPEERLRAGELTRLEELVAVRGSVHDFATTRLTKDGHAVPVSVTCGELTDAAGDALGYSCVIRLLLPHASLADRLYESEKLAALRTISAGFAHEIGNPLAGVTALLQLVARRTQEPATRERLASAHAELTRVARIIRELADFTRQDGESVRIDVNEVLRAALTLAHYGHPHARATVVLEADRRIPPFVGSRNHLLQVFLHLAINAYEAIGDGEGRLRVVSRLGSDEILVVFEDTGSGIPPQALARLFEPFFTTKASTGLGLFVCRRIVVDELGGTIVVESEPGAGARFSVRLPLQGRPIATPSGHRTRRHQPRPN